MALEYLEGEDLHRILGARRRVDWRTACAWLADACVSVHEAHEVGIVHRDLKPSNVFLARTSAGDVVKVLDFGIAKAEWKNTAIPKLTNTGIVLGTLLYMSPEQLIRPSEVGPRADIWSMGAMLHHLVAGEVPFPGETMLGVCSNILMHPPRLLSAIDPAVPKAIDHIVLRCLEEEPDARFVSVARLEAALRAAAQAA